MCGCSLMKVQQCTKAKRGLRFAGFIGSQRYTATWTGDNLSTREHLHMSVPMVVQLLQNGGILLVGNVWNMINVLICSGELFDMQVFMLTLVEQPAGEMI